MRILSWMLFLLVGLIGLITVVWGALALWYRAPEPAVLQVTLGVGFAALGLRALMTPPGPARRRWGLAYLLTFGILLIWWNSLTPATSDDWSPEVARQVTGVIEGDVLTLTNARAFEWQSETEATEIWQTQTYDLTQLESADLFMSYWAGPAMAHLMISFGFADGRYLTWSYEVRRSRDETFSPLADFFKSNPLSLVAGREGDIVGLRSNIQLSEVYRYRLQGTPERARILLEGYVASANALSETPRFFHSLFTNCSRAVVSLARHLGADLPLDWRVLVNGYFPEYLYEIGALDSAVPFETLRESGNITTRARDHGLGPGFSAAIRATP